jgi:lipopolysaccharide/colanic/teichoic acid biosynthesis glycosyltransferase
MSAMSSATATSCASEMSTSALPASHAILAENAIRRAGHLIIACALIIVTLPLMAIVALAIKLDSFGPVFYRQERVGLNGRRFMLLKFRLLKFRSMVVDAEPMVTRSGQRNVAFGLLVSAGLSGARASMSYRRSLMFCAAT